MGMVKLERKSLCWGSLPTNNRHAAASETFEIDTAGYLDHTTGRAVFPPIETHHIPQYTTNTFVFCAYEYRQRLPNYYCPPKPLGVKVDYSPAAVSQEIPMRLRVPREDEKCRRGPRHNMILAGECPQ